MAGAGKYDTTCMCLYIRIALTNTHLTLGTDGALTRLIQDLASKGYLQGKVTIGKHAFPRDTS